MKLLALFLAILPLEFVSAQELIVALHPTIKDGLDYRDQLTSKFKELIGKNQKWKEAFEKYSVPAEERAGGKYMELDIQPLVLRKTEDVDFSDSGGRRQYSQTIALYCSFSEGQHRGMSATAGVFAVFQITGEQIYGAPIQGIHPLNDHRVTTIFDGFTNTIRAEQGAAANP